MLVGLPTKRATPFDLAMDVLVVCGGRRSYRLIICGSATSQNKGKLEDMIKVQWFSRSVEYIGFVPSCRFEIPFLVGRAHVKKINCSPVLCTRYSKINYFNCASGKHCTKVFLRSPCSSFWKFPPFECADYLWRKQGVGSKYQWFPARYCRIETKL